MNEDSSPQIKINPEYAGLVSRLSTEEYSSLKQSIKEQNGLLVPIILNRDRTILDGHHRYKACRELGIEPKTLVREFKDKLDERLFVVDCNLIRRNLNIFQRTELALKAKPILEAIVKRNESLGGKGDRNLSPLGRIDERIGDRAGVSRDTVRKVEKILNYSKLYKFREDLRLGEVSINKAYEMVELDLEHQMLYQKCLIALVELKKSSAEIYDLPEQTRPETERLKLQGEEKLNKILKLYTKYFEKRLEYAFSYSSLFFLDRASKIRKDGYRVCRRPNIERNCKAGYRKWIADTTISNNRELT